MPLTPQGRSDPSRTQDELDLAQMAAVAAKRRAQAKGYVSPRLEFYAARAESWSEFEARESMRAARKYGMVEP